MTYHDLERDLSLARKFHELRRQDCHLRGLDEPVWDPSLDDYPKDDGSFFFKGILFAAAVVAVVEKPKVSVKTIENWMMTGSDVFRLHHAVARARDDLTAAGIEVVDDE